MSGVSSVGPPVCFLLVRIFFGCPLIGLFLFLTFMLVCLCCGPFLSVASPLSLSVVPPFSLSVAGSACFFVAWLVCVVCSCLGCVLQSAVLVSFYFGSFMCCLPSFTFVVPLSHFLLLDESAFPFPGMFVLLPVLIMCFRLLCCLFELLWVGLLLFFLVFNFC